MELLQTWFAQPQDAVCIVCGAVSGNLEMLDFDGKGILFEPWKELIDDKLLARLVIERSPSGGMHVFYRCKTEVNANMKLARRDGRILIETRGEGGLFLCAPTVGYELIQGGFDNVPVLTDAERKILLEAAWSFDESKLQCQNINDVTLKSDTANRPGDEYNERGDVRQLLKSHGWTEAGGDSENQRWRRPGKTKGWSATLRIEDDTFYVFSSNAIPFEPGQAYAPFAVYAMLEHDGDYAKAASELLKLGYGEKPQTAPPVDDGVDLSGIIGKPDSEPDEGMKDPGQMPEELMRAPGFISELMDFCLQTAPYPNQGLAFCGALAMQSYLCGRKIRDAGNLRTNLYLLALAGSGIGKDWPRQINAHIMMEVGAIDALGDKFTSGEGLQDSLNLTPCMLFLNDEIDGMLVSVNKARDARHESIMSNLLTIYTSSGSIYAMRRKAGQKSAGVIDQPHLTLFGTATPKYYYESLNERMLTNGFFARMMAVDVGNRGAGQSAGLIDNMSETILETAKWWTEYQPGTKRSNLFEFHPRPEVINADADACDVLDEFRDAADLEYSKAESKNDEAAKAIWARANENARKLSLLYAASEMHQCPKITKNAALWACQFVEHQIRRMIYLTEIHVADNPFHAECLKIKRRLKQARNMTISHSVLLKRMKIDSRSFQTIIDTLIEQGDVERLATPTKGRTRIEYQLKNVGKQVGE